MISSPLFLQRDEGDFVRLLAKVTALKDFLATDDGANLLAAYRAMNIVRIEEKKTDAVMMAIIDPALLHQGEEKQLYAHLSPVVLTLDDTMKQEQFADAMGVLTQLRALDGFFDQVTVNCEDQDVRANRLRMLSQIGQALDGIADFAKLEG